MESGDQEGRKPYMVSEPAEPGDVESQSKPGNLLHKAASRAEGREFQAAGQVSRHEDKLYSQPIGWKYWWKPPAITFGFGLPAIALIVGQMWLPELSLALGNFLGEYVGLGRLAMLFFGGWMLMLAAPFYKPPDWTPEKQKEINQARKHFRNKRGL